MAKTASSGGASAGRIKIDPVLNVPGRIWQSLNVSLKQLDAHDISRGITINDG
ncbi:hypothetical protein [Chitinophaga sp. CF418]|uniref:hypothetical protein n=1 Tax=Chitinophaga sp. CF418 TaxID=1855287 RepID=UPI00091A9AAC|nr:hypothetical protein [Chitinophaga sp. CF418]SHL96527.1 hypothetical protein SAMN05216311_101252 [Chitinophaga sp. CF418]